MTILAKFQCDWADEHDVYGPEEQPRHTVVKVVVMMMGVLVNCQPLSLMLRPNLRTPTGPEVHNKGLMKF